MSKHRCRETAQIADNKLQLLRKNLVVRKGESNISETDMDDPREDIEDSMPVAKPGIKFLVPQHKCDDYHYHDMDQLGPPQVDSPQPGDETEDSELERELDMEHGGDAEAVLLRAQQQSRQSTERRVDSGIREHQKGTFRSDSNTDSTHRAEARERE